MQAPTARPAQTADHRPAARDCRSADWGSFTRIAPRLFLVGFLVASSLAFSACGDNDSGEGSATAPGGGTAETTAPPATEPETTEPAGSEPTPGGEAARSEKVKIVEFSYVPDPVVVAAGGKVIWQNEDMAPHTATAEDGSFDTGTIEQGKLQAETFDEAGTYPYFCEIHPDMRGTVEVVG